jgi:hypothetical protein
MPQQVANRDHQAPLPSHLPPGAGNPIILPISTQLTPLHQHL